MQDLKDVTFRCKTLYFVYKEIYLQGNIILNVQGNVQGNIINVQGNIILRIKTL